MGCVVSVCETDVGGGWMRGRNEPVECGTGKAGIAGDDAEKRIGEGGGREVGACRAGGPGLFGGRGRDEGLQRAGGGGPRWGGHAEACTRMEMGIGEQFCGGAAFLSGSTGGGERAWDAPDTVARR